MSVNSKRARALQAPTAPVSEYKAIAAYIGTGNNDDALLTMAQVVAEGVKDPSVKATLNAANLRNFKKLNLIDSVVKPISEVETLFRVGNEPLNGGYVVYTRVDLGVQGAVSVTDKMQASTQISYTLNNVARTISVLNFYFVVMFYENNVLKSIHTIDNSALSLTLIALDAKIDAIGDGGNGTQVNSDWNATDGPAKILNKPTLFSGNYNDLSGKPLFASVAFNGQYGSLLGTPDLHIVATSGSYNDLSDKPTFTGGSETANTLQDSDTIRFDDYANDPLNRNIQPHVIIENLIDDDNTDAYIRDGRIAVKKYESAEHTQGIVRVEVIPDATRSWVKNVQAYLENFNILSQLLISQDDDNSIGQGGDGLLKVVVPKNTASEYEFEPVLTGSSKLFVRPFIKASLAEGDANITAQWIASSSNAFFNYDRLQFNLGDTIAQGGRLKLIHTFIDCTQLLTNGNAGVGITILNYRAYLDYIYKGEVVPNAFLRVPKMEVVVVQGTGNTVNTTYTVSNTSQTPIRYFFQNGNDLYIMFENVLQLDKIVVYLDFN